MARREPLVCQHLENVSRVALEKYQRTIRQYIRRRHGIYALYRRNKLRYVGLATNLTSRLRQHLHDQHGRSWDRFSVYLTIGDRHMKELESLLLRIVQPRGNKQRGHFPKSEHLRRRLARDVRRLQKIELNDLVGRQSSMKPKAESDDETADQQPKLAKYLGQLQHRILKADFKGKPIRASIRRDGSIRFRGKTYRSPSMAAAKACGRRTCNGWTFWTYERAPGDWVRLKELRH